MSNDLLHHVMTSVYDAIGEVPEGVMTGAFIIRLADNSAMAAMVQERLVDATQQVETSVQVSHKGNDWSADTVREQLILRLEALLEALKSAEV